MPTINFVRATGSNVALTCPASQFANWNISIVSLAVADDPVTRGCSVGQNQSWWSVDLGSSRFNIGVKIVNNSSAPVLGNTFYSSCKLMAMFSIVYTIKSVMLRLITFYAF